MTLLIPFSGWLGGIYLLLPLERRMWFITKEWWISQEGTRLHSAVTERSALSRQCFLYSPGNVLGQYYSKVKFGHHWSWFQNSCWLHQSQVFLKRIAMNILSPWSFTLIAKFSPWNYRNREEKKGSEGMWEKGESKLPSPFSFMGRRSWLLSEAHTSLLSSTFCSCRSHPFKAKEPMGSLSLIMLHCWHFLLRMISQQLNSILLSYSPLYTVIKGWQDRNVMASLRPQVKKRWWRLLSSESCWRSSLQMGWSGALAEAPEQDSSPNPSVCCRQSVLKREETWQAVSVTVCFSRMS